MHVGALPLPRAHPVMIVVDSVHLISRTEPIMEPDHSPAVDQRKRSICQANATGIYTGREHPDPAPAQSRDIGAHRASTFTRWIAVACRHGTRWLHHTCRRPSTQPSTGPHAGALIADNRA